MSITSCHSELIEVKKTVHVVLVGQLPPPVHGQALAIQRLVDAPWSDVVIHPVRLNMSDTLEQVGKGSFRKFVRLWKCAKKTRKLLKQYSPAVLYYPPGGGRFVPFLRDIIFLSLVRGAATRVVLHFHAGGVGQYAMSSPLRRLLAQPYMHADIAVKLGDSCPADGEKLMAHNVRCFPVGIPDPSVSASAPSIDSGAPIRVLYVGHLTAEKGLNMLPQIAADLEGRAEFHIIGEWASTIYKEKMEPKLRRANIIMHGGCYDEGKWEHFKNANVLLFPSRKETQGMVAVEAMACGLPIVASRIDGIRNVVTDASEGFLVDHKSSKAFAEAISLLGSDQRLWKKMSRAGKLRFDTEFTLDIYRANMRRVFVDCMAGVRD